MGYYQIQLANNGDNKIHKYVGQIITQLKKINFILKLFKYYFFIFNNIY